MGDRGFVVGDVLMQRAAKGDVQGLMASANGEERQVKIESNPSEFEVVLIVFGAHAVQRWMSLGRAVAVWIDVWAAHEAHSIKSCEDLGESGYGLRIRGQDDRDSTGSYNGVAVKLPRGVDGASPAFGLTAVSTWQNNERLHTAQARASLGLRYRKGNFGHDSTASVLPKKDRDVANLGGQGRDGVIHFDGEMLSKDAAISKGHQPQLERL